MTEKVNAFAKLGRFIVKRKKTVILAWIIILALVSPFLLNLSGVISLQMGSISNDQLDSVKAQNIIDAQFNSVVPEHTLVIVISTDNVSSIQTQEFISKLTREINSSSTISGIESITDVYSILVPLLNQTNQGGYLVLDNANMTYYLLYGVPATYLQVWSNIYSTTYSMTNDSATAIATANANTHPQTAVILNQTDPASYTLYTSHLLDLFNNSWCNSFLDPATASYTVTQRASYAADQANQVFINTYLASNQEFFELSTAITNSFTLQDFLTDNQSTTNLKMQNFAAAYVSNSSGLSTELVNSTLSLGKNPSSNDLKTLAGAIIWNTQSYNLGEELNSLVTSFVSPSKDVTLISINFASSSENFKAIRSIISSELSQNPEDIQSALVTGSDALDYDFNQSTTQDIDIILPFTIILLVVATGLFFRSIVTPLVTLGAIGVALGISQIFLYLVGTYINKVDFMIPTILLTIVIGVGTDYAIFVVARHREELIHGLSLKDSIVKSVTWAGESIATSGITVILSFLSLAATSIILVQTMGIVVGLGVIVTLLIALTFVPALATLFGDKLFWPNSGERFKKYAKSTIEKSEKKTGYFLKSGEFSVKHAKVIILAIIIVTIPMTYVYASTAPTYDFLAGAPATLESITASNMLTSSFGSGRLSPTYVVVTFDQPLIINNVFNTTEMSALQAMSADIINGGGVQEVKGPTSPYGSSIAYQNVNSESNSTTFEAITQYIGSDNKSALLTVTFSVDPYSNEALTYAQNIREDMNQNYAGVSGITEVYVGGTTGSLLDTKNQFTDQFNLLLPLVAIGVFIVLFFVLGSLTLPIFAIVSILMSVVWTLAVTSIVFKSIFNYGLLFITPLILFVLLLGLGMDYNIFILTRIREEAAKGKKLNGAIIKAIENTGGIITAAAIILAGSLASLMLSSSLLLKELGFAIAFSILIDALVVRTYLVPAVMSLLGKWNWYNPIKRLRRVKEDSAGKNSQ